MAMIGWLQPAALWALALLSAPLLIHLLRARYAPTLQFPTVRFVRASPVASVRIGRPSDLLLLAVRMAIVGAAVLAMAQPLFISEALVKVWNARIARAIVVDSSESMRQPEGGGSAAAEAGELASAEARTSTAHVRIETPDLESGLRRAARWLETALPARREIVVLSDFQHGALHESAVRDVPPNVGLRFVAVGEFPRERRIDGLELLEAAGIEGRTQNVGISERATTLVLEDQRPKEARRAQPRLRLVSDGTPADQERLLRALARAGTPAPRADRPVVVQFAPTSGAEAIGPVRERWMLQTIVTLEQDSELRRAAQQLKGTDAGNGQGWTVLIGDENGNSLLRAAAVNRELLLDVGLPITTYFAAAVARAALVAAHGPPGYPEQDVLRIPTQILSAWNRSPAPVGAAVWRNTESSDAHWLWAAALVLMALEGWLRKRRRARQEDTRAAA